MWWTAHPPRARYWSHSIEPGPLGQKHRAPVEYVHGHASDHPRFTQPKTPFRRKSELMMTSPKFITEINFKHLGQPITL